MTVFVFIVGTSGLLLLAGVYGALARIGASLELIAWQWGRYLEEQSHPQHLVEERDA